MIIHLPDPVAVRLAGYALLADTAQIEVPIRDAGHRDALAALLAKAHRDGFALEIKLIHYKGCPDATQARRARKGTPAP